MRKVLSFLIFLSFSFLALGQGVTKVRGTVIDGKTGEPLPFVNVVFTNSSVGTTTDLDGKFSMDTRYATESVTASFLGYEDLTLSIQKETRNDLVFRLLTESIQLESVVVVACLLYTSDAADD